MKNRKSKSSFDIASCFFSHTLQELSHHHLNNKNKKMGMYENSQLEMRMLSDFYKIIWVLDFFFHSFEESSC
jgi:hypothetical protein